MGKFFEKIRPIAAFIGLGLLGLHLILLLVYMIGSGVNALSIVGWIVELLLVGTLAFAFFAKKDDLLKAVLVLLLAYFAVGVVLSGLNGLSFLGGDGGMVFTILAMVSAVAALALFLLRLAVPSVFDKPLFKLIILALVASIVVFGLIGSIFVFAECGKEFAEAKEYGYDVKVWPWVIYTIDYCIVLPTAFLFCVLVYEGH